MIRHRRNNVAAALVVLGGALVMGFGAFLPLVTFKTMTIGLTIGVANADLGFEREVVPPETDYVFVILGVWAGIAALLLLITRVRGLGVLWRLGALASSGLATFVCLYLWDVASSGRLGFVEGVAGTFSDQPRQSASFGDELWAAIENLGVASIGPGPGLYAVSIGIAIMVVGCCIPAIKRHERVQVVAPLGVNFPEAAPAHTAAYLSQGFPTAPAGWYATDGGHRYWNGTNWTDSFSPGM